MTTKQDLVGELNFCIKLWEEKWWCSFWVETKCEQCATPYLLLKLINWEHLDNVKLSLADWKEKFNKIKD